MTQLEMALHQICVKSYERTFFGTVIHAPKKVCQIGRFSACLVRTTGRQVDGIANTAHPTGPSSLAIVRLGTSRSKSMIERQCTPRHATFCFGAVLAATMALQFPCRTQAMLFWDADETASGNNSATGAGLGGSGVWGSASNWFNGTGDVPWTAGSDAVFSGTAGV